MEFTKAKMTVAAIGAFVEVLKEVLLDNVVQMNEWASLVTSVVILGITVWRVWATPNQPIPDSSVGEVRELG